jgi:hypothetical protein
MIWDRTGAANPGWTADEQAYLSHYEKPVARA